MDKSTQFSYITIGIISTHLFHLPVLTNLLLLLGIAYGFASKETRLAFMQHIKKKAFWISSSIYLVYVVSLSYSINISKGIDELIVKLPLLCFPFLFSFIKLDKKFFRTINRGYIISLTFTLLFCLIKQLFQSNTAQDFSLLYNDNFGASLYFQAVYFGIFVNIGIAISLVELFESKKRLHQVLFAVSILFFFAFHFLLISKIALIIGVLTILIGAGVMVFRSVSTKKTVLILSAGIALIFVIGSQSKSIQNRFQSIQTIEYRIDNPNPINHFNGTQSTENWNSVTARLATWECVIPAISETPIFGHGIGAGQDALMAQYSKKSFILGQNEKFNTHNQYFDIALNSGLIGLFLVIIVLALVFIKAVKQKDIFSILIFTVIFVNALTENVFNRAQGVMLFALFFSLICMRLFSRKTVKID